MVQRGESLLVRAKQGIGALFLLATIAWSSHPPICYHRSLEKSDFQYLELDGYQLGVSSDKVPAPIRRQATIRCNNGGEIWFLGNTALVFWRGRLVTIVGQQLTVEGETVMTTSDSPQQVGDVLDALGLMHSSRQPRYWALGIDKNARVKWPDPIGELQAPVLGVTSDWLRVSSIQLAENGIPDAMNGTEWETFERWLQIQLAPKF